MGAMGGLQPWHWLILLLVLGFVVGVVLVIVRLISRPSRISEQRQSGVAPAGWYPDPSDPTALRYFDGRAWVQGTPPYPRTSVR